MAATQFFLTTTALVEAIVTSQQPSVYDTYSSPDGQWQMRVMTYEYAQVDANANGETHAYEQLLLTELSSGQEIPVATQLQSCGGLGAAGLEGLFWSENSHYFYYTDSREGMPDGCGGFWQQPIYRLEISTLQGESMGGGTLSPDGTKLDAWQERELIVRDVNEGTEIVRLPFADVQPGIPASGALLWSPDSQSLVAIQAESYCPLSGQSVLSHVDLTTGESTLLLESESPTFGNGTWEEANELILLDEEGKGWIYTLDDGQLEPVP